MPDSDSIEEQYQIGKSVFTSYVASSLCFEYVLAQNKNRNEKGEKFLMQLEQLAKESIQILGIPENHHDMEILNEHFVRSIKSALRCGLLES